MFNGAIPGDLDSHDFSRWMDDELKTIRKGGKDVFTVIAQTPKNGRIPIGLAVLGYDAHHALPNIVWFPEATPRNKLEALALGLIELKKQCLAIITCSDTERVLFDHLCRYGVLRKVGHVRGFYPDGSRAWFYQSVGHGAK